MAMKATMDSRAFLFPLRRDRCVTFVSSREGDLIVAVVPPVLHALRRGSVTETNHVVDLAPSVLTYPPTAAAQIAASTARVECRLEDLATGSPVDGHVFRVAVAVRRWSLSVVVSVEVVTGHDHGISYGRNPDELDRHQWVCRVP